MTGAELNTIRMTIGRALGGDQLSYEETRRLCGLRPANGADTIRKWEVEGGPSGPVAALLEIFALTANPNLSPEFREFLLDLIETKINTP